MMLMSLFLAFFLPCAGMSAVFVVYICLLWYASARSVTEFGMDLEKGKEKGGLSKMDLEKIGTKVAEKEEEVKGKECAVCLEDLEIGQVVRWLPDCHHGFHVECADAWLSKHPVCPVCRAQLGIPDTVSDSSPHPPPFDVVAVDVPGSDSSPHPLPSDVVAVDVPDSSASTQDTDSSSDPGVPVYGDDLC